MHIKFLKHGQGSAASAVRYLLQDYDHTGERRASVEVLRGSPDLVAAVADSSRHQWSYSSGVIAWAPDDQPTGEQIQAVVADWERAAFAGLESDQFATCAVLHRDDDGTAHVHTLTARVELGSGKSLNPAPPGHERLFDPLRDYWNHMHGWARPDDPDRARAAQPGMAATHRFTDHERIAADIQRRVDAGDVRDRADVLKALAEHGAIARTGRNYVSVRPVGAKRNVRLRGTLFSADWTIEAELERQARREQRAADGQAGQADPAAAAAARERLETAIRARAAYNQKRYPRQPEPAPLQMEEPPHEPERNSGIVARTVISESRRIREAEQRIVGTATAIADDAERAAARNREARQRAHGDAGRDKNAAPGDGRRRSAAGREDGAVDAAIDAAASRIGAAVERIVAAVEQVTTAYGAWQARQAERDRQDRLAAETERAAAAASTPPTPQQPPEPRPEQPKELAERILLMNNPGERLEAIRAADTGDNMDFVDALDEHLADIGVGHLGELAPMAERRRAKLLGEQSQEQTRSKRDAPVAPPPESGPQGPGMG